jgi:hypothetical protein
MPLNDELLARIDERVKTLFNELREIKDDVREIKEGMGICPFGSEAHATMAEKVEALETEASELRGGRKVAYMIVGAGIAIAGILVGFII